MQKQIDRAKALLEQPSKARRIKYLKSGESKMELNEKLIAKATKLLGVKGYYTDIEQAVASNGTIIERYHNLYKIEQAFRVAKGDLRSRPIFHFKENPIQLHMLICFMALAASKHIEIFASISIRAFLDLCKKNDQSEAYEQNNQKRNPNEGGSSPRITENYCQNTLTALNRTSQEAFTDVGAFLFLILVYFFRFLQTSISEVPYYHIYLNFITVLV